MQGESPAYRGHYADLDPTYRDAYGHPLLRITFNWTDNERKMVTLDRRQRPDPDRERDGRHAQVRVGGDDHRLQHRALPVDPLPGRRDHGRRTRRPRSSTSACQVWEVPNLFVVGAANFPQNAGYNPTGTVGALAYRAADAIINQYLPSPGPLA